MEDPQNTDQDELIDYRLDIDSRLVDEWTRMTLFPKVKFLYEDKDLEVGGRIHVFFIDTCRGTHTDMLSDIGGLSSPSNTYRRQLWKYCIPRIRKHLSVKRSGVTNQIAGNFSGKQQEVNESVMDKQNCITNKLIVSSCEIMCTEMIRVCHEKSDPTVT